MGRISHGLTGGGRRSKGIDHRGFPRCDQCRLKDPSVIWRLAFKKRLCRRCWQIKRGEVI